MPSRRSFAAGLGATVLAACRPGKSELLATPPAPADPIDALAPLPDPPPPIDAAARRARVASAQRRLRDAGLAAVVLEPGPSLDYYQGVSWWTSERPFYAVIPAAGDVAFVCPGFEEARARELITLTDDVRVWQEDESPYALLAGLLRDRGIATGRIAIEEQVRFFVSDGLRAALPAAELVPATAVVTADRLRKAPAELALMQRAHDITVAAFRAVMPLLAPGMSQSEAARLFTRAQVRLGGSDPWALVLFGEASAFPHGSTAPRRLREGDVVLMDVGCDFRGYQSDITRTTVVGTPTARQRDIWALERRAQDAAFAAAQPGATCDSVDAAARKVITDAGFGPDYAVPGLPHRTGHGIGMQGHEPPYIVRGNTTRLEPGMCFSIEPTIAIYGEFGVRLEDCVVMTEQGPRSFAPRMPEIGRLFA
ncbi:MAG: Xaa-Pro peptidase family protein [Gemmatimonadales bacterium]|jgi:Xaa-Pro dipeptidase|nr:Xaa-Pro peptidase family protein [Gemmatimonadales bacterium]